MKSFDLLTKEPLLPHFKRLYTERLRLNLTIKEFAILALLDVKQLMDIEKGVVYSMG